MNSRKTYQKHILLINCGSSYFEALNKTLSSLVSRISVCSIDDVDSLSDLTTFDCVVISGSPKQFVEIDSKYYLNKISSVLDSTLLVLGICFGHQLIGLFYGADIFQEDKRTGDELIRIRSSHLLFKDLPSEFIQQEFHREHISLPKDFILLASSKRTDVEAMVHISKLHVGLQFHPEISGVEGVQIFKNFLDLA